MKYFILLILSALNFSLFANDSTKIRASLPIQPIVVNMSGDTAVYMHWKAYDVDRADTAAGMGVFVFLLNKYGKTVANLNLTVPAPYVKQWALDPKPIDDFILSQNPRLKRKTQ